VERRGALGGIEGEDALAPPRARQALRLLGLQPRAGRDDEHVVKQDAAVVEDDVAAISPDLAHLLLVEHDAVSELPAALPRDLVGARHPEGDEEEAGLIDVPVVAVDHVDLDLVRVEAPPEPVRHHRPAGAAAQDDDPLRAHAASAVSAARSSRRSVNSMPPSTARRTGQAAATFSSIAT
jgi:hypothetical protein